MGPVRWLMIYPQGPRVANANLGFLWVVEFLRRDPRINVEQAYAEPKAGGRVRALESGDPIGSFHIAAFSISFELDYIPALRMLNFGGMPLLRHERRGLPLICAGGVAVTANPEPLAPFIDLAFIGEAEGILGPFVDRLIESGVPGGRRSGPVDRDAVLRDLSQTPGVYVPGEYEFEWNPGGGLERIQAHGSAPKPVKRVWGPIEYPAAAPPGEKRTVFGRSALVEMVRGCGHGCRFCLAGYVYRKPRVPPEREVNAWFDTLGRGCEKAGLIGASILDVEYLNRMVSDQIAKGRKLAFSSFRADKIGDRELDWIQKGGIDTVTLAPEAATDRMRRVINKNIDPGQLERTLILLARAGVGNIKLYFIIGLPGEEDEDARAIGLWLRELRAVLNLERPGVRLRAGIAPLVPKPHTPFQWAPMADSAALKRRLDLILSAAGAESGIELAFESVPLSLLQGLLSRGDRRLADLLRAGAGGGRSAMNREMKKLAPAPEWHLRRTREENEPFPWEVVDMGLSREFLLEEWRLAGRAEFSPACAETCTRCGVCAKQ